MFVDDLKYVFSFQLMAKNIKNLDRITNFRQDNSTTTHATKFLGGP